MAADSVQDMVTHLLEAKRKLDEAFGAGSGAQYLLDSVPWHIGRVFDRDLADEILGNFDALRPFLLVGIRTGDLAVLHDDLDWRIRDAGSLGAGVDETGDLPPAPASVKPGTRSLVGGDQVDAVRAFLNEDFDEYRRFESHFLQTAGWHTYWMLVQSACLRAVERRFETSRTDADVDQFVAWLDDTVVDQSGNPVDSAVARQVVRALLRKETMEVTDFDRVVAAEALILAALVADMNLADERLDQFLEDARRFANDTPSGVAPDEFAVLAPRTDQAGQGER